MARVQATQTRKAAALTTSFDAVVELDVQNNLGFRRALLQEAVGCMVSGDLETGKSVLRKYINGTVGFVQLGPPWGAIRRY